MGDRREQSERPTASSPPLVERTVPPGSDEYARAVWRLKERIHRVEGLLDQRRAFFDAVYRQSTCYLSIAVGSGDATRGRAVGAAGPGRGPGQRDAHTGAESPSVGDVVGFAVVRADGYLSLLGVDPGHRRRGLGSRLLERVAADHPRVSCHVRTTNGGAIGFYADHGFLVRGTVEGYYRDGTAAYLLARDPDRADRLSDLLG